MKPLALISLLALTACSGLPGAALKTAAGAALGGGPNVAANGQAGRTNSQTVGASSTTEQHLNAAGAQNVQQSSDRSSVKADAVHEMTVNEMPAWVVLLAFLAGWEMPTRRQIADRIGRAFGAIIAAFRKRGAA
ncbi:bacteriophage spanin2 family protein [Thioclava sediminum]|uniref:bacteriophage spanin2 family protein n=1 Tax=Thioclava sediminum TaxID=1915319 RepID=UPI0011BABCB9|nr:bacteriophage spanin2 family protein [Thioclava sediminum]